MFPPTYLTKPGAFSTLCEVTFKTNGKTHSARRQVGFIVFYTSTGQINKFPFQFHQTYDMLGSMTDNVIRPAAFRNAEIPFAAKARQTALTLYSSLFNLHHNVNKACLIYGHLMTEMGQNRDGVPENILPYAGVVTTTGLMFEEIRDSVAVMMKILVLGSTIDFTIPKLHSITVTPGEAADDQPPYPAA